MTLKSALLSACGGAPSDPYFEYTTLLLHGDGTNGGQNNTFLDSSSNNFTITRNGNATQGSFSPYGSLWSNYFDGSSNLSAPTGTDFDFGTGDFTVEGWVNPSSNSADWFLASSSGSGGFFFGYSFAGTIGIGYGRTGVAWDYRATSPVPIGQWSHIAVTRSGTSIRIFLNGTQVGTTQTSSQAYNLGTTSVTIGSQGTSYRLTGSISNLRVNKGTALYTANFTPSTTPLAAVSGTVLLTCQSNRFLDQTGKTITVTGTPKVTRFSPFAPAQAYAPAVNGGSGYFDGASGWISAPASTEYAPPSGTSWTIEGWFYLVTAATGARALYRIGSGSFSPVAIVTNGANLYIDLSTSGSAWNWSTGAKAISVGQWYHLALVRNGATTTAYLNGVSYYSAASVSLWNSGSALGIGAFINNTSFFPGYISNLRVNNGDAVYTSNFTPPSAPLTASANTKLLLNFTNGAIFDSTAINDLETVGNAQISTAVKKFGTGSLAFDGAGDYLVSAASATNQLNGNFTIEFWMYPTSIPGSNGIIGINTTTSGTAGLTIRLDPTNKVTYWVNGSGGIVSTTNNAIALNTWTHIALVRNGTTNTLYINGIATTSNTATPVWPATPTLLVGRSYADNNIEYLNGYLDEVRITPGIARYTANFTPPSAPFPNQ